MFKVSEAAATFAGYSPIILDSSLILIYLAHTHTHGDAESRSQPETYPETHTHKLPWTHSRNPPFSVAVNLSPLIYNYLIHPLTLKKLTQASIFFNSFGK